MEGASYSAHPRVISRTVRGGIVARRWDLDTEPVLFNPAAEALLDLITRFGPVTDVELAEATEGTGSDAVRATLDRLTDLGILVRSDS